MTFTLWLPCSSRWSGPCSRLSRQAHSLRLSVQSLDLYGLDRKLRWPDCHVQAWPATARSTSPRTVSQVVKVKGLDSVMEEMSCRGGVHV